MGGKLDPAPYIRDARDNKFFTSQEKENTFREMWKKTFRISHEENIKFNPNKEREVNQFINDNIIRIKPLDKADLSRLNPNNELAKPFVAP